MVDSLRQMLADTSVSHMRPFPSRVVEDDVLRNGVSLEDERKDAANAAVAAAAPRQNQNGDLLGKSNGGGSTRKSKVGPKVAQTRVTIGMRLKRWVITGRIGAGSFGETFTAVEEPKDRAEGVGGGDEDEDEKDDVFPAWHRNSTSSSKVEVCIKVEQENKNVLRVEVAALKKMQPCPQVVRYLGSGNTGGMNFLVMQRLGPNLAELRRSTPTGILSSYTTLKLGISCLKVIQGIHELGLLHRDIKPSNFVIGVGGTSDPRTCYLIDFGLARRFRRSNGAIRPPREHAGFRGTSRYASLASHHQQELGRVDDIWSLLFMLIEFATGTLPWRKYKEKEEIGRCKEEVIGPGLVQHLPREFRPFLTHLQTLHYEDEPNYEFLISLLERAVERRGYPPDKPFDWECEDNNTGRHIDPDAEEHIAKLPNARNNCVVHKIPSVIDLTPPRPPTNAEGVISKPLDVSIVPAPEAMNMKVNLPTSPGRLVPQTPRSEFAETDQQHSHVGISDVNVSVGICRGAYLQNDAHHDMEGKHSCQRNDNANATFLHSEGDNGINADDNSSPHPQEENKKGIDVMCTRQGDGKVENNSMGGAELKDIQEEFSPREEKSDVGDDENADKDMLHPRLFPFKNTVSAQLASESEFLRKEDARGRSPGGTKKKVSFASDVKVAEEKSRYSKHNEGEIKKKSKGIHCRCDTM